MSRPNILVFLSDDHGQWASRPYGNRELVTPTLDHLARCGARMGNAFTPCPAERREANAQYYAAVSVIDEMAGRVLDELADQQAEQDTLVVYTWTTVAGRRVMEAIAGRPVPGVERGSDPPRVTVLP